MINIEPGNEFKFQSTGYTPGTIQQVKARLLEELNKALSACEPIIREITVHNNTKTANIRVAVIEGHMHIAVSDPDENFRFSFERSTDNNDKEKEKPGTD
jgi:hypothetical protein